MATVSWIDGSGNWTSGSDWSTGSPPGPGDDALLGGTISSYMVSLTSMVAVKSITIHNTGATLVIADPGGTETISAGLVNSGGLVMETSRSAMGNQEVNIGGTLTNASTGVINIASDLFTGQTTVTAGGLANAGDIVLIGQDGTEATLDVTTAAPTSWTGTIQMFTSSLLEFASGSIANIASGGAILLGDSTDFISVAGSPGSNSALSGLISNGGVLQLAFASQVVTSGDFTNSGTVSIDESNTQGGSTLSIGGTLTNDGMLLIGNNSLSAPTLVSAAGLILDSNLDIAVVGNLGQAIRATLDITGGAPAALIGTVNVLDHAAIEFGSGSISSIAIGGILDIEGASAFVEDIAQPGSNSALVGLISNAGFLGLTDGAVLGISGGFTNSGSIDVDGFTSGGSRLSFGGTLSNDGTIGVGGIQQTSGSSVTMAGAVSGSGTIDLAGSGSTVEFGAAVASGQTLSFTAPSGTVRLDDPTQFAGTIAGLAVGAGTTVPTNDIDLTTIANSAISSTTLDTSTDRLNVVLNGGSSFAIQLSGSYASGTLVDRIVDNSGSGTDLFLSTPICFCRGTLILTDKGEAPVEDLAVGDRVVTLSGAVKPIRWIGFGRDLVTRRNSLARPIIVRAGALADDVPRRDLYLTHGHALYLDGVLIPVEHLVNHRSILWDEEARVVEYYHIELADHDVLFAEGAPAESYYDADNRALFQNAREGSAAGAAKPTCAPVLNSGETVERVWAGLLERAGGEIERETTDNPGLHLVVDGERLDPASVADGVYTFALAGPPAGPLMLSSRGGVPSLLGLNRHEHRRLGVAIRQIILQQPGVMTCFDHDAPSFREGGCYLPEAGHCWTDGDLALTAPLFAHLKGAFTVLVHTGNQTMRYPIAAAVAEAA